MPPLQQPCVAIGNTIICLLMKGEKEETPEYYDIRYADYRDALMENDYQGTILVYFPKYKFELDLNYQVMYLVYH